PLHLDRLWGDRARRRRDRRRVRFRPAAGCSFGQDPVRSRSDTSAGYVDVVEPSYRRAEDESRSAHRGRETLAGALGAVAALHRGEPMKKMLEVTLGILTAIGGFVDIGDLVANSETGARFRMSLAWVVVVGVIGIVVYAEMAGRVATISKRPVFDLIRERMGARTALVNLIASLLLNLLT